VAKFVARVEHIVQRDTLGHRKRQIEVRPAIGAIAGERADEGRSDDAIIFGRQRKHSIADAVTVNAGEHVHVMISSRMTITYRLRWSGFR
jgi:hypothetical protein